MSKFKVGDKVKLSPSSEYVGRDYQLPLGVIGEVIGYGRALLWYRVRWDSMENSYQDHDLIRAATFKGNK